MSDGNNVIIASLLQTRQISCNNPKVRADPQLPMSFIEGREVIAVMYCNNYQVVSSEYRKGYYKYTSSHHSTGQVSHSSLPDDSTLQLLGKFLFN